MRLPEQVITGNAASQAWTAISQDLGVAPYPLEPRDAHSTATPLQRQPFAVLLAMTSGPEHFWIYNILYIRPQHLATGHNALRGTVVNENAQAGRRGGSRHRRHVELSVREHGVWEIQTAT